MRLPFSVRRVCPEIKASYSAEARIKLAGLSPSDFLFPNRIDGSPHLLPRRYARLVHRWIGSIGLDDTGYGTHTMRRTKASLIYRRTKNLRPRRARSHV